jgi:hypothetical protein
VLLLLLLLLLLYGAYQTELLMNKLRRCMTAKGVVTAMSAMAIGPFLRAGGDHRAVCV